MNINDKILFYIKENAADGWTDLNDFLKKENRGNAEIRKIIHSLIDKKLILIKGELFRLGSTSAGFKYDLENVPISARLLADGEQRLDDIKMKEKSDQTIIVNGDNNGHIEQLLGSKKKLIPTNDSSTKQIIIGLIVTVVGGLVLYWIIKELS